MSAQTASLPAVTAEAVAPNGMERDAVAAWIDAQDRRADRLCEVINYAREGDVIGVQAREEHWNGIRR